MASVPLPSKYQIGDLVKLAAVSVKANPVTVIGVRFRRQTESTQLRISYEVQLKDSKETRVVFDTSLSEWIPANLQA